MEGTSNTSNQPSRNSLHMLHALQGRPLYGGTVTGKVKAGRRAANKAARASRRRNRGK